MTHFKLPQMSMSASDRRVALQAGYVVSEDPNQPRLFQWVRRDAQGNFCDACESSFVSERAAWTNAITTMIDAIVTETGISWDAWPNLSEHMKVMHMQNVYGLTPPSPCVKPTKR